MTNGTGRAANLVRFSHFPDLSAGVGRQPLKNSSEHVGAK